MSLDTLYYAYNMNKRYNRLYSNNKLENTNTLISRKLIDNYKLSISKLININGQSYQVNYIDGDAIIFEPNSLGRNKPSKKLIVDVDQLICAEEGLNSFRRAYEFLNKENIYKIKLDSSYIEDFHREIEAYDINFTKPYPLYVVNGIIILDKINLNDDCNI